MEQDTNKGQSLSLKCSLQAKPVDPVTHLVHDSMIPVSSGAGKKGNVFAISN